MEVQGTCQHVVNSKQKLYRKVLLYETTLEILLRFSFFHSFSSVDVK